MAKSPRVHFVAPQTLIDEARARAEFKGISLSEHIKDLLKIDAEKGREEKRFLEWKESQKS